VTAPIADKYESAKKVATQVFKKEKSTGSISHFQGDYDRYENEDVEISKAKVTAALLGAALVGTVIWSFTSEKGKTTRKRAVQGTKEAASTLKTNAKKLAEEVKNVYEDAKVG